MSYITREGKFTCNKHALQKQSSAVYETEQQDWHTLRFVSDVMTTDMTAHKHTCPAYLTCDTEQQRISKH